MIGILILNWNGWHDTIECVKSLQLVREVDFSILIVDNGSSNDSVTRIIEYLNESNMIYKVIEEGNTLSQQLTNKECIIYKLRENYGFAKGNNLGLKLLADKNVDYYWILNNDTIVEKESLLLLQSFMESHPQYAACTPQIRYFNPNNRIWNCGGKLFFGFRKYFFEGQDDILFKKNFFDVTFVTGCALFIRPELLNDNRQVFTERFFFGEEDFEFSLRLKEQKKKMACCTRSIIYHKVSASTKNTPKLKGVYIYYLNRYINIRQHFSMLKFFLWRKLNNVYISSMLRKKGFEKEAINELLQRINRECFLYEGVSKEMFDSNR